MVTPTLKVGFSACRRKGRIAFVTPRYGESVVGGSEAVVREAAHGLAERGYEVDAAHDLCARTTSPGRTSSRQARRSTVA